jgi:hypothetical protein
VRSEKGLGTAGSSAPSTAIGESAEPQSRIREFKGLEATFAGRVIWLGGVAVLIGVAVAFLSLATGPTDPRVNFCAELVVLNDQFAGPSYWGCPFPYLRIACRVHSDGAWEFWGRMFVLDALIWALPALPIMTIVLTYRKVRRMERWRRGVCLRCEYDLRGLTEPRCPECGTPFEHVLVNQRQS